MKRINLLLILIVVLFTTATNVYAEPGSSYGSAEDLSSNSSYYTNLYTGETDMYHFEVPFLKGGAYNIYSTGSTDVKAYLYEEQNFLWHKTYDLLDYDNNNGYKSNFYLGRDDDKDDKNDDLNTFLAALDLDGLEDYYIKVRGNTTSTTGNYRIYVKENFDYTYDSDGGSAVQYSRYHSSSGGDYRRDYLGKDEAVLLYLVSLPDSQTLLNREFALGGFDGVMAVVGAFAGMVAAPAGVAVAAVGFVAHLFIDYMMDQSDVSTKIDNACNISIDRYEDIEGEGVAAIYVGEKPLRITYYDGKTKYGGYVTGERYETWTSTKIEGEVRERWLITDLD